MDPIPLEEEFPLLAASLMKIANHAHPTVYAVNFDPAGSTIFKRDRSVKRVGVMSPNDLCHCGSNVKFKKCHGKNT